MYYGTSDALVCQCHCAKDKQSTTRCASRSKACRRHGFRGIEFGQRHLLASSGNVSFSYYIGCNYPVSDCLTLHSTYSIRSPRQTREAVCASQPFPFSNTTSRCGDGAVMPPKAEPQNGRQYLHRHGCRQIYSGAPRRNSKAQLAGYREAEKRHGSGRCQWFLDPCTADLGRTSFATWIQRQL